MKGRFNSEEWKAVQRLPIHMFSALVMADGKRQWQEAMAISRVIEQWADIEDPLHRELFAEFYLEGGFDAAVDDAVAIAGNGESAIDVDLQSAKEALAENLTDEEYHRFLVSLSYSGVVVAEAAGAPSGRFGPSERAALEQFLQRFNVDAEAGRRALGSL